MSKLPTWEQAEESCESGNGTALERFIYENEPQAFDDEWRKDLAAAIAEQRQPAVTHHCPACEAAARERVICACGDEIGQAERIGLSQIGAICGNCAVGRKDYDARMELADLRARLAAAHNELRQITLALNDERIHNTITLSEAIAELRRQIDESEEVNRTLQARIQRLVDGGAEDRETLVNRLRSLSRQNEQLTLEAADRPDFQNQ